MRPEPPRGLRWWLARAGIAIVAAIGSFCLVYHFVFWFLWRFLFGEDVWPWPQWSLWFLVVVPSLAALAAAVFLLLAKITRRNIWIAVGLCSLSLFGLLRYAGEVHKVLFQLGFRP
jgi:hypothetical protein